MKKLIVTVIAAAMMFSGCATAYQKTGFSGGFSETQLGENIFQVSFKGNAFTSRERASDFNLLRSAEVALEKGFNYFIIVNSEKYTTTYSRTTPITSHTTGSVYGTGNNIYGSVTTTTTGGQTYYYSSPVSTNKCVGFKEKPSTGRLVYKAAFIIESIKRKYGLKQYKIGKIK